MSLTSDILGSFIGIYRFLPKQYSRDSLSQGANSYHPSHSLPLVDAHKPLSTCPRFRRPSLHLPVIHTPLSWPWVVISNLEKLCLRDQIWHAILLNMNQREIGLWLFICVFPSETNHHLSFWSFSQAL